MNAITISNTIDAIDDIGLTRSALNALVNLMMPTTLGNKDGLDHVDRGELAELLGLINLQLQQQIAKARSLAEQIHQTELSA